MIFFTCNQFSGGSCSNSIKHFLFINNKSFFLNVTIDIPKYMSEKEEAEQKEETNEEE